MVMSTSSATAILSPSEIDDLVVRPVLDEIWVASLVSTVIFCGTSRDFRVPLVTADPTASWVAEGAEISPSDASLYEYNLT